MKITKSQLRRIIKEEKARLLEGDKYAQLPPTSHERVTGLPSEFVEDNWLPWLAERGLGAEDLDDLARFTGAPDRSWLPAAPPADGMDGPADLELWARHKKTGILENKMKITKRQLRRIIRESIEGSMQQDLSTPIPIDDLVFVDEEGYGAMMFPGAGYSYSVREANFEAEKAKLKQRYGDDVMISTPDPRYPKVKKIHSAKFDRAQSRENQNFMRHQRMMGRRMGREPGLGS